MPPKAPKGNQPSKKTEQKKKEKVIEDKTFGIKNKKGAKQQKFIQQVEKQVKYGQQSARKLEDLKNAGKDKKDEKKKTQAEMNELFKPVITQKINKGADPKSVVCAFFKQGQCGKGDKCKFSHDIGIERKGEKRSAYVDLRENEGMDDWDEEKLKEVVDKKHAESNQSKNTTDIICRYFLDALEKSKYGWFWECPNGEKCMYRHALPPGFVLKKDKKKEEKGSEISIEDLVEKERAALGHTLTKVTYETFIAWKKKKIQEKKAALAKETEKRKTDYKAGKSIGFSGREMFTFNPELATGDQMEEGDDTFDVSQLSGEEEEETEVEEKVTEVNFDFESTDPLTNGTNEIGEAAGGVPIDENLFAEDDEDLEELEQDLENLELEP